MRVSIGKPGILVAGLVIAFGFAFTFIGLIGGNARAARFCAHRRRGVRDAEVAENENRGLKGGELRSLGQCAGMSLVVWD